MSRIMIIEGEECFQEVLKRILEEAGYEIVTSDTGLKAMRRIECEMLDMVLTTDKLPGIMDGLEIARQIKFNPNTKHILVFMLLEEWKPESIQAALEAGADGFNERALNREMFLAQVKSTLDDSKPS